jgi:hypothetical protein
MNFFNQSDWKNTVVYFLETGCQLSYDFNFGSCPYSCIVHFAQANGIAVWVFGQIYTWGLNDLQIGGGFSLSSLKFAAGNLGVVISNNNGTDGSRR